jgi:hypothetical protein
MVGKGKNGENLVSFIYFLFYLEIAPLKPSINTKIIEELGGIMIENDENLDGIIDNQMKPLNNLTFVKSVAILNSDETKGILDENVELCVESSFWNLSTVLDNRNKSKTKLEVSRSRSKLWKIEEEDEKLRSELGIKTQQLMEK